MDLRIAPLANGDWQAFDEEEDSPLITIKFHNQLHSLPVDHKKQILEAALAKADELAGTPSP